MKWNNSKGIKINIGERIYTEENAAEMTTENVSQIKLIIALETTTADILERILLRFSKFVSFSSETSSFFIAHENIVDIDCLRRIYK